jgi:hypothetical protein
MSFIRAQGNSVPSLAVGHNENHQIQPSRYTALASVVKSVSRIIL